MGSPTLDNQAYYDEFSNWYERERHRPYHRMLDDLEVELVQRYGHGADVLEVGCGTGLLLERIKGFARSAKGIDLSPGMLEKAAARGLDVQVGSATSLPFADQTFDVVCSFKVLAHVPDIRQALTEMARVTRPGGWVLAEFYNSRSLRRLVKALKPATAVSEQTTDEAVYTRYDSIKDIESYVPPSLRWISSRGVRIVTPFSQAMEWPIVGDLLRRAEAGLADVPVARDFGGFLVACLQKQSK